MIRQIQNYILDKKGNPVPCSDLKLWAKWLTKANRIVQQDALPNGLFVSTVFLGIDCDYLGKGKPILWETMIFNGKKDQYQRRYTSLEDAKKGHMEALKKAGECEHVWRLKRTPAALEELKVYGICQKCGLSSVYLGLQSAVMKKGKFAEYGFQKTEPRKPEPNLLVTGRKFRH